MWKAVSLAIGITAVILGIELFFVDQLEVRNLRLGGTQPAAGATTPFQQASWSVPALETNRSTTWAWKPRDWMPWSLLATGTIIVIYTFTLPIRRRDGAA